MTRIAHDSGGFRSGLLVIPGVVLAGLIFVQLPLHAGPTGTQAARHGDHRAHTAQHSPVGGHASPPEVVRAMSIPPVEVVDQDGNTIDFYRDLVEGRVVAINFIFTTCTTICPPMGATFSKLQTLMSEREEEAVHLISVSVDPVTDTPERLKAWGATFHAGAGWTLVTGEKQRIDTLLKALRVFTPDKDDHSPIILLGDDKKGVWTRTYGLAPPDKLASVIEGFMSGSQMHPKQKAEAQR